MACFGADKSMRLRDDKRKFRNPFEREAKVIVVLIVFLGLILLATVFLGPFVD